MQPLFECELWPDCHCPDGTHKLGCPGLIPYIKHQAPCTEPARLRVSVSAWIGLALCTIVFWGAVGYGFVWAFNLPTVYESYTTGNCVRVDDTRGAYSCENMPTKYHHKWAP